MGKKTGLSILLLILVTAFFSPVLFFGRSFSGSDTVNYTEPMRSFAQGEIQKGSVPLWNPYIFCGLPSFAGSNEGSLYPVNILLSFMPSYKAVTYNTAIHFFLAGIFMMLYAFCFTESVAAVFLAMVIWVFSGMFSFRIDHLPVLQAMAYIPLFFFAIEKYSRSSNRLWLFVTALTAALAVLIGHGQTAFYMFGAGCIYYPARMIMQKKNTVIPGLALLMTSLGLGLAMAAAQILPTYELISFSPRSAGMAGEAILKSETITWINLLNTLFPFLFGSVNNNTYIGIYVFKSWFISYIMLYTGAVSILFYFIAARRAKTAPIIMLFAAFILFSFFFAMGQNFPLNYFAVKIPLLNKFRNPAMMLEYYVFFTAALCALTAGSMKKEDMSPPAMKTLAALAAAVLLAAAAVFIFKGRLLGVFSEKAAGFINKSVVNSLYHHYPPEYYMDKFVNTFSFISAGLLKQAFFIAALCFAFYFFAAGRVSKENFLRALSLLVCAELFANMAGYQPVIRDEFFRGAPESATVLAKDGAHRVLQCRYYENESIVFKKGEARGGLDEHLANREVLRPDRNVEYGVFSMEGYGPVVTKKYYDFYSPFENAAIAGGDGTEKLIEKSGNILDAAAVKYILTPYPFDNVKGLKKAGNFANLILYERDAAPAMVNFVPGALFMNDDAKILENLRNPDFDMKNKCMISSSLNTNESFGKASCPVNIKKWEGGHINFELTAPSSGYAVVSSLYYPGWNAEVDGVEAKILNANYVFSAVKLTPGHHTVGMDFEPASFRLGLLISATAFVIYILALIVELITGRKKQKGIVS